jgi:hypothetical protein
VEPIGIFFCHSKNCLAISAFRYQLVFRAILGMRDFNLNLERRNGKTPFTKNFNFSLKLGFVVESQNFTCSLNIGADISF